MRAGSKSRFPRNHFCPPASAQLIRMAAIACLARDKDLQSTTASMCLMLKKQRGQDFCHNFIPSLEIGELGKSTRPSQQIFYKTRNLLRSSSQNSKKESFLGFFLSTTGILYIWGRESRGQLLPLNLSIVILIQNQKQRISIFFEQCFLKYSNASLQSLLGADQ